jgi:putative acetyltransferase
VASQQDALVIAVDDPRADDVRLVLERHLSFAHEQTPVEYVHALDVESLLDPAITFYSARRDGRVLGVGAIKQLDPSHAELKSMHTIAEERGQGVARALLDHLLSVATKRGATRVSLETGTTDAFEPARRLYRSAGFVACDPFGTYTNSPRNYFMTKVVGGGPPQ